MIIKAIETNYKNYRFRSRLEARWAIFLDKLGIEWEYELQGFDLGDDGKYLPDFHLVENDIYVEVKPRNRKRTPQKFYLAGKFGAYDENWRSDLVDGDITKSCSSDYHGSEEMRWMLGGNYFVGPYGLDEITGGHGVGEGHVTTEVLVDEEEGAINFSGGADASPQQQRMVFDTCKKQIASCDVVFAWIDETDCFGTIAEIGFAYAIGKKIWIAFSPNVPSSEFWFIQKMADRTCVAKDATNALVSFVRKPEEHEKKCMALSKHLGFSHETWLIEGEPGIDSHQVSVFRRGQIFASGGTLGLLKSFFGPKLDVLFSGWSYSITTDILERAVIAARSARFEHGEKPA